MIFLTILALWIILGFILGPIIGVRLKRARQSQSVPCRRLYPSEHRRPF